MSETYSINHITGIIKNNGFVTVPPKSNNAHGNISIGFKNISKYGVTSDVVAFPDGVMDAGISGIYENVIYSDFVPDGIPYAEMLTQYYDLTNYNGETEVINPCLYGSRNMQVIGGLGDSKSLVLEGTETSYAKVPIAYNAFTVYCVMKIDDIINNWQRSFFGNSYARNRYQSLFMYIYNSAYLQIALYGVDMGAKDSIDVSNYFVFAISGEAGVLKYYLNGVLQSTGTIYNIGNTITLGCDNVNGSTAYYYRGTLRYRCLSVFEKCQTDEQIEANSMFLYNKFISEVV